MKRNLPIICILAMVFALPGALALEDISLRSNFESTDIQEILVAWEGFIMDGGCGSNLTICQIFQQNNEENPIISIRYKEKLFN